MKSATKLPRAFPFQTLVLSLSLFNQLLFCQNHQEKPDAGYTVLLTKAKDAPRTRPNRLLVEDCRSDSTRVFAEPWSSFKITCQVYQLCRWTSDPVFPPGKCLYYKQDKGTRRFLGGQSF
jgi:hypothetical protein